MHAQNQKYTLTSVRVRLSWLQRATARRRGLNKISNRNSQDVHISDSTNCWHNKRHHSTTCIVYTAYEIYRRERYTRVFSVCWKQSNMTCKAFGWVPNSLTLGMFGFLYWPVSQSTPGHRPLPSLACWEHGGSHIAPHHYYLLAMKVVVYVIVLVFLLPDFLIPPF
jgi:hypothetical protein